MTDRTKHEVRAEKDEDTKIKEGKRDPARDGNADVEFNAFVPGWLLSLRICIKIRRGAGSPAIPATSAALGSLSSVALPSGWSR